MELTSKLAAALASQYLQSIEPQALAAFLLTREVAVSLLTDRLRKNPIATIQSLQRLPTRKRPGKGTTARRPARKAAPTPRRPRRQRLSPAEIEQLKNQVKSFLASKGWATRKQLTATIALDTQAIYRRIMTELQQEGVVVSKGQKSKAVYALKTGRRGAASKTRPAKKKREKRGARKASEPA